jgi:WhiB family transcriptional regulator, redox-sensing transcriptional regulator
MIERRFRHDPDQTTWIEGARCIGEDPELFFPMGAPSLVAAQTVRAKAVCDGCPVLDECLEWSLATAQDAGVWGGLDEDERRELRRHRRRAATLSTVGR